MAGFAHRRWHKTLYLRMSWIWCVGTCRVPCTWGSHPRDRPSGPGKKTARFVRDASRRTSSWRLCWSTEQTRTTSRVQSTNVGSGPHGSTTNHNLQPMVAEIFKTEL